MRFGRIFDAAREKSRVDAMHPEKTIREVAAREQFEARRSEERMAPRGRLQSPLAAGRRSG